MGGKTVPTLERWRPTVRTHAASAATAAACTRGRQLLAACCYALQTKLATVASIFLLLAYGSSTMLHSPGTTGKPGLLPPTNDAEARPTLQFAVCNGFTNQRIALLSGGQPSQPSPAAQPSAAHAGNPARHATRPSHQSCCLAASCGRHLTLPGAHCLRPPPPLRPCCRAGAGGGAEARCGAARLAAEWHAKGRCQGGHSGRWGCRPLWVCLPACLPAWQLPACLPNNYVVLGQCAQSVVC